MKDKSGKKTVVKKGKIKKLNKVAMGKVKGGTGNGGVEIPPDI